MSSEKGFEVNRPARQGKGLIVQYSWANVLSIAICSAKKKKKNGNFLRDRK